MIVGMPPPKVAELRAMSYEEIERQHDELSVGWTPDFYLNELRRRDAERAERASYELARQAYELSRRTYWLTVVTIVFAALSLTAAIIGIGVAIGVAQSAAA